MTDGNTRNTAICSKDRLVKKMLENRELRAEFFRSTIAELKDMSREEIMSWMVDDGDCPKGLNTENILPNGGMVRYDALYRLESPRSGGLGIYVNIEAQSRNDALEQDCRSVAYCGTLLSLQVADVRRRGGYRHLDRVYSIWICLNPPRDRMAPVYTATVWMQTPDPDGTLRKMRGNLLNIIYVNIRNDGRDTDCKAARMMGILLGGLPEKEKLDMIRDKFNIDLGDGYTEGVDTNFIYQDGYDQGFDEGMAAGKAEERALHIRAYADTVLRIAETNGSVEEALSIVRIPDDCIDEVRAKVLGRSGP